MDTGGKINDLGRQYIGAISPNVTVGYTPGAVTGGNGGRPSESGGAGDPSRPPSTTSTFFGTFAAAFFVHLLI